MPEVVQSANPELTLAQQRTTDPLWRTFEGAIVDYRQGRTRRAELLAIVAPLIDSLAERRGRRFSMDSASIEDLSQEILIAFDAKILDEYDANYPLQVLLDEWMDRTAKKLHRLDQREVRMGDIAQDEAEGDEQAGMMREHLQGGAEEDNDALNRSIDAAKAIELWTRQRDTHSAPVAARVGRRRKGRTRGLRLPSGGVHTEQASEKPMAPEAIARFQDHDDLLRIQKRLDITREEYARLLGITKSRLASYLYKAVLSVSSEVMLAAKTLELTAAPRVDLMRERYRDAPMDRILADWVNSYNLPDDDAQLAAIFEVTGTTLKRWRAGRIRPGLHALDEYERLARRAAGGGELLIIDD